MADQKPAKQDAAAAAPAAPPPASHVEDIPDPDEDDLDDLDDVLDEFSATKLDDSKPPAQTAPPAAQPSTSGPDRPPPAAAAASDEIDEEEFAKQLQAGMAELLGGLGDSPEMAQQLESLVKELGASAGGGGAAAPAAAPTTTTPGASAKEKAAPAGGGAAGADADFQEQIRRTMERMQASGEQASAAAASSSNPDDMLAQMLAEMEKGGFGGAGEGDLGSDEDFSKMLMGMMEQLTNKEILYEPMKELHDKFPDWLAKNREKTSKADLERYDEQQRCVKDIVERFERPGYSDDSTADREFIVDKMQKQRDHHRQTWLAI
ncbi:Pex19 protein [Neofusicoccum parvum]|uniref:Pex19 protein n=2 Tax=Neofusicoccum parvum TaxID=310453 RepID=A0ACB5S626_9PEZI|nr:putative pex19 protein [Neofusicoccum parvum UCRNP2]GME28133.1 Pex19 protein [Neofusicoccum parvum]GME63699.1 Pex19 protein [Neofusicoccum parvum]